MARGRVITRRAVRAAAGAPTAIARGAALKEGRLRPALDRAHRVARKDVFRRVLRVHPPAAFPAGWAHGRRSLHAEAAAETGVGPPVRAGDGQTSRRSHERGTGLGAWPSVRVGASQFGRSRGQGAGAATSPAIPARAARGRREDVTGAIRPSDARGPPKASAAEVIPGEADDVRTRPGNQETRPQAVIAEIAEQLEGALAGVEPLGTPPQGPGRPQGRTSLPLPAPEGRPGLRPCRGRNSRGLVTSRGRGEARRARRGTSALASAAWGGT